MLREKQWHIKEGNLMELYKPKAVTLLGRELHIRRSIIKDYCAAHSVLGMEDGKTALQTSNSKHNGEKWDRRRYLIKKDTSRETDVKTSDIHISWWVTSSSSYHLLCRDLPPSKATPSACLESLLSGSENYPKDIHCLAPCFQAGNLFPHAPRSYSSSTYQWTLLTS